jgi:hypothetical protein
MSETYRCLGDRKKEEKVTKKTSKDKSLYYYLFEMNTNSLNAIKWIIL